MSEKEVKAEENGEDPKAKFREALERKKKSGGVRNNNIAGNSKVSGSQVSGGGAPQVFRRKSGSA